MGKIIVMLIVAVLLAVAIYLGFGADAYLLVRVGDWAAQVTLLVALFCVVVCGVVASVSWQLFKGLFLGAWPGAWRRRQKQNLTHQILEHLAMTNWSAARKDLVKLANKAEHPAPLIMLSAEASEALGDYDQAKTVYKHALEEFPRWAKVIQARLCHIALEEGDLDAADARLVELTKLQREDTDTFFFRARLAEERQEWPELRRYLAILHKKKHHHDGIAAMERRHLWSRLKAEPGAPELTELKSYVLETNSVPSSIVGELAQQLAMRGLGKDAELMTRKVLERDWSDELMEVYSELDSDSPQKQLKIVEGWSVDHPGSVSLLTGLKTLSMKVGDDTKAEEYQAKILSQKTLELADNT